MAFIQIKLSDEEKENIKILAIKERKTLSEKIVELIRNCLKGNRK